MLITAMLALSAGLTAGQEGAIVYTNARIYVSPGQVVEKGSLLVQGGRIAEVGKSVVAPAGAKTEDLSGMTVYPAFIHPGTATNVAGVSPAPSTGGFGQQLSVAELQAQQAKRDKDPFNRESNFLLAKSVATAEKFESDSLQSLAEYGYGLARIQATGGLISARGAIAKTGTKSVAGSADDSLVSFSLAGRGFGGGGYPTSTMGVIYVIRQTLIDAQEYGGGDDLGLTRLKPVLEGKQYALFDDLTETSYFQAQRIAKEFKLSPVYGFRSDSGAVKDLLKSSGAPVLLQGRIPVPPRIGDNLDSVSLAGVRQYFNEVQAGAELEKAGIPFAYSPATTSNPFEGLRTYVRGGLSRKAALASVTTEPARILGVSDSYGTLEKGKVASFTVVQGDILDSSSQVMQTVIEGKAAEFKKPEPKDPKSLKPDEPLKLPAPNHAFFPAPAETTAAYRLYKNATVWTEGPRGTIPNCDVLVKDGKLVQVGPNLSAPNGCQVVDATGKHISPGIWDCHSHTAILGSVNESTNMITAECRIRDCMNQTDTAIYQQLSGGTVGANQLHGSANAIGGQNNVVKWRWGLRPDDYHVQGSPEGVKFALGQNPISEDDGSPRSAAVGTTLLTFRPRTRMGVEEAIRRALQLGKEYNQAWEDFNSGKTTVKPHRDLQLEALGEIANGSRWIHSHGYRQDELLMLIRIGKQFGTHLATLQHVLEGYKIADEMAAANVGGSTFSDWWGFKLESYDAIPYNAALMAQRGVVVSVNSDSNNHARRLNIEAAKSMRYGGVDAQTALSFVTINPAKQLGIDKWTGSLEAGKDADFVVWSHEPTSIYAVALETYVDGVKRFDRANDAKQRAEREQELLAAKKILESNTPSNPFTTGGGAQANTANEEMSPTTATFGLADITGEPGTVRYPRGATLIQNATIHPMAGAPFTGDILIGADGKIASTGKGLSPKGAEVVDGTGKHVYPGLIDPSTGLGMAEIGQVPASDDSSERGDFHPDYRAERTINAEWDTLGVARQQGILTAVVKPSGGGIPGQAALINTEGYTWEDLTIQGGVALMYSVGRGGGRFGDMHEALSNLCRCDDGLDGHDHDFELATQLDLEFRAGQGAPGQGRGQGQGQNQTPPPGMDALTQRINDARDYAKKRAEATPDKPVARDQRQEAMLEVAEGRLPVMISANTADDIKSAVKWAEDNHVRILLYGCTGAGEIADWLAAKKVPVILASVFGIPRADQPLDYYYGMPARLAKAGVKFALTMNENQDTRQLRDIAGWSAAYGLDREDAARSITLWPAQILGIDSRVGALKPGMEGTVILADGEITEISTKVERAWIQGREVSLTNRQTRLYEKYGNRPGQTRNERP